MTSSMEDPKAAYCRTCSETIKFPRNLCDAKYKHLLDLINRILGYEVHTKSTFYNICDSCESKLKWILEFKELCEKTDSKFRNESENYKQEAVDETDFDISLGDDNLDFKLDNSSLEDTQSDIDKTKIRDNQIRLKDNLLDDSSSDSDIPIIKLKLRAQKRKRSVSFKRTVKEKKRRLERASKTKLVKIAQFPHDEVEKTLKEFLRPFELNRTCIICDTMVCSRKRLGWHMSAVHKKVLDKWCNICNTLALSLDEHKMMHNDLFKCPFCKKNGKPTTMAFIDHLQKHTNTPVEAYWYPCKFCPNIFAYVNELRQHQCPNAPPGAEQDIEQLVKPKKKQQRRLMGKHGKQYKQFAFEQVERALKETMRLFHTTRQCAVCGDITKNLKHLTTHMELKHRKMRDKWCDKCNLILGKLEKHKDAQHTIEDKVLCPFCQTKFKSKTNLQEHLMNHSNSRHFKPKMDWFICTNCPKAFPYENELQTHNCRVPNINHIENEVLEEKPNSISFDDPNDSLLKDCSDDKEAWSLKRVKNRKWSHLEQFPHDVVEKAMKDAMRPFYTFRLCPICHFLSKTRQGLATHIATHRNARDKWCSRCNNLVENIGEHKKIHEEYLFNCPFCRKGTNDRYDFDAHLHRHTLTNRKFNEKWYCCPMCPSSFPYEDGLKAHICVDIPIMKKFIDDDLLHKPNGKDMNISPGDRSKLKAILKATKRMRSKLEEFPHEEVEKAMKQAMRSYYTIRECPICETVVANRARMGRHISFTHKEVKDRWCNRCNTLVDNLDDHKRHTHETYLFNCPFCKKEDNDRHEFEAHLNRHSLSCGRKIEAQWFICQYCPSSFPYEHELSEHKCPTSDIEKQTIRQNLALQLQTKAQPSQAVLMKSCQICKKEVKYLADHLKTVHNKFRRKTSDIRRERGEPEAITKSYLCSFCGRIFKDNTTLKTHIMSRHTGERPYKCSYCDKGLISKTSLKNHEETMHGGERKYFCDVCGKACSSYSTLYSHKLIHGGQPPQQCPICEKFFVRPYLLKVHMKRHTDANRFSCAQCNASYHLKRLLLKHLRTHTNERPYKCRFCDKTWRFKAECTVHERVHTGTNPYVCTLCPFSARLPYALTTHMKQHPEDAPQASNPHKCPLCNRSFSTNAMQISHTNHVHMSFTDKGLKPDYVSSKEK